MEIITKTETVEVEGKTYKREFHFMKFGDGTIVPFEGDVEEADASSSEIDFAFHKDVEIFFKKNSEKVKEILEKQKKIILENIESQLDEKINFQEFFNYAYDSVYDVIDDYVGWGYDFNKIVTYFMLNPFSEEIVKNLDFSVDDLEEEEFEEIDSED